MERFLVLDALEKEHFEHVRRVYVRLNLLITHLFCCFSDGFSGFWDGHK